LKCYYVRCPVIKSRAPENNSPNRGIARDYEEEEKEDSTSRVLVLLNTD
jgi:hypothetical protein